MPITLLLYMLHYTLLCSMSGVTPLHMLFLDLWRYVGFTIKTWVSHDIHKGNKVFDKVQKLKIFS